MKKSANNSNNNRSPGPPPPPPPPPPPGFCFTIWFPQQRQREKTRDRTSCLKTRESRKRKKEILILIISNQDLSPLLFSPLSSSSSSLACSSAALLLQATLRPCWEPENGRARTARAGNQRTAVPVPPVQGDQRAGRHGGTGPSGGPHAGNPAGFLEFTHSLTYT